MLALLLTTAEPSSVRAEPMTLLVSSRDPAVARVLAEGVSARRELMGLLGRARIERDIVRVSCYDRKLSELNATIRNLEVARPPLPPRLVEVTAERVRELLQEARECVCIYPAWAAEPTFTVEVVVDPRIPREDPSVFP